MIELSDGDVDASCASTGKHAINRTTSDREPVWKILMEAFWSKIMPIEK
jgi:hypothetical protein